MATIGQTVHGRMNPEENNFPGALLFGSNATVSFPGISGVPPADSMEAPERAIGNGRLGFIFAEANWGSFRL